MKLRKRSEGERKQNVTMSKDKLFYNTPWIMKTYHAPEYGDDETNGICVEVAN